MDGNTHSISMTVLGNNIDGFWALDAALLLSPTPMTISAAEGLTVNTGLPGVRGGRILSYYDSGAVINVERSVARPAQITFNTTGYHKFEIVGLLELADGCTSTRSTSGNLKAHNINNLIGIES